MLKPYWRHHKAASLPLRRGFKLTNLGGAQKRTILKRFFGTKINGATQSNANCEPQKSTVLPCTMLSSQ